MIPYTVQPLKAVIFLKLKSTKKYNTTTRHHLEIQQI
jgi:hypothetical protein